MKENKYITLNSHSYAYRMFHYFKDFFERLSTGEKVTSIVSGFVTWFGGLLFLDSTFWGYTVKGVVWLVTLAFGTIIPKVVGTYYENTLKDKIFKSKTKKDANKAIDDEAA